MVPFNYTVRSLMVRKASTLSTSFGIALVIFVLATALMLSAGVRKTMMSSGRPDNAIVLRRGSTSEIVSMFPQTEVGTILRQPSISGAQSISEVVVLGGVPKARSNNIVNVMIRGVPPEAYAFRPEVRIIAGRSAQPGTDEVVIGKGVRGRLAGVELDQSFELLKGRSAKVVGVFESGGSAFESEIWADREVVRAVFGRMGLVSSVHLRLPSRDALDRFKAELANEKNLGVSVMREDEFYGLESDRLSSLVVALGGLVSTFVAIAAMLGAAITMYGAVARRQREIGTMRALGFPKSSILTAFLLESMLIAIVGGLIGTLASLGTKFLHFSLTNPATFSETTFTFDPTPRVIGTALGFALLLGIVGGLLPALRASRVSVIEALRGG